MTTETDTYFFVFLSSKNIGSIWNCCVHTALFNQLTWNIFNKQTCLTLKLTNGSHKWPFKCIFCQSVPFLKIHLLDCSGQVWKLRPIHTRHELIHPVLGKHNWCELVHQKNHFFLVPEQIGDELKCKYECPRAKVHWFNLQMKSLLRCLWTRCKVLLEQTLIQAWWDLWFLEPPCSSPPCCQKGTQAPLSELPPSLMCHPPSVHGNGASEVQQYLGILAKSQFNSFAQFTHKFISGVDRPYLNDYLISSFFFAKLKVLYSQTYKD